MTRNQDFKDWMVNQDKKTVNVSNSYSSYLNIIEEVYGNVDDYLDTIIDKAIEKDFTEKKFKGKTARQVLNYKAGLRKYWTYIKSRK